MKRLFTITALAAAVMASAQDSTTKPLTISGYVEAYYSFDVNRPINNTKAPFIYSFNRSNEVGLNLGYLKASYNTCRTRANLALAAGTYINANYSSEPGSLKNVFEADVGIKIAAKQDLWIDGGIFASHIGFESAVGKDSWNLTRSILADNSPYYESGVKVSYTSKDQKWFLSALLLNGWQHIQRPDGNTTPGFGTQVTYKPSEKALLNYSTFIGNNQPDSLRKMRYFNNLYGIIRLSGKWGVTAGFDYGLQQKYKGSSDMNTWYSPVLILRYVADGANTFAARVEYYSDANGVIVPLGTPDGFKLFGWSINYDRQIAANFLWRIEVRRLNGKDNYFAKRNGKYTTDDTTITTSLAMGF